MTIQDIALFQAMGAKMNFLDQRQQVLAQNMANADTPNYRPYDLKDVDFNTVLKGVVESKNVRVETTHQGHMPSPNDIHDADARKQRKTYEVAPAGNSVIIEEQMVKATRTTMDYNLLTNLMRKNVGMIRTALGRTQ